MDFFCQPEDYKEFSDMYAIDLFAGCGGLSKGFTDAGFDIILGVDNDPAALNTFKLNHSGATILEQSK